MPVVNITLIKGYSADARRRLSTHMTNIVTQFLGAVCEGTTVIVNELDQASYMRGYANKNPAPPPPPAADLVRDYLSAMQARDLQAAGAFLDGGFWMEFPGGVRMRTLEELIAWSKPRYRSIGKTFDSFSEAFTSTETIVVCHGTLHGEWPDGTPFEGIRFVDRFTVAGGKITSQMVWNDLAEMKAPEKGRDPRKG